MLHLDHISAQHGEKTLFSNISFTVAEGEFVSLIGPNGAGKTSLLKAIIGLLPVSSGRLTRAKGCRIGYMPQKIALNPLMPLTVKTFLSLSPLRSNKEDVILETGIQSLLDASMHSLSGGEYQRVILARALLNQPNLLILDEPTQGLDAAGETHFFNLLEHLHKHHRLAILMVSHDLHFVHKASQKVICINQSVCCSGAPQIVQGDKAYQDLFHSSLNKADHTVEDKDPLEPVVAPYIHHHSPSHDNLDEPTCCHNADDQTDPHEDAE